jgi:hypothetical protein
MTTNVLVTFYSTYGHVHRMALAVVEGAESVPDADRRYTAGSIAAMPNRDLPWICALIRCRRLEK